EGIENIPPAIAIEQKNAVKSSRSTVGTASEVLDYLRLLYEKIGQAYCPDHHIALKKDSVSEGSARIVTHFAGERGYILAPISKENRPVSAKKIYEQLLKDGIRRIYIPPKASSIKPKKTQTKASTPYYQASMGKILELENDPKLKKSGVPKEDFFVVIDRMAFSEDEMGRIADSLSQAYSASLKYNQQFKSGRALIVSTEGKHLNLSEDFSCSICSYSFPPISSRLFSFNSPIGACPKCKGFGNLLELDEKKIIPQPNLSLAQGALIPFTMPSAARDRRSLLSFCKKENIDVHSPWKDLPLQSRKLIWEGSDRFYGIKGLFDYLETKKYKMHVRVFFFFFKSNSTFNYCQKIRLCLAAHQVLIQSKSLSQLCEMTSPELHSFLKRIEFSEQQIEICKELYRQLLARLSYLEEVGIGYLTMDRSTKTLSGGEFQRLNLANQLGMGLSQTLYVLDEPTVGLHPRDNLRLINILKKLQNQGNTLVVVEHDHDVIWNASQIIEIGPGSGQFGGEVLFSGKAKDFLKFEKSNTLPYLLGQNQWKTTSPERPVSIDSYRFKIEILGCTGHNLKNVDLIIPLHRIVTVTGVSGSGKSSLVTHSLYPALVQTRENMLVQGLSYKELRGAELIKGLLMIDQSPIGKTARSNPVTYLKVYDFIRNIFANTPEAKAMGFSPGTFSLNVEGGRCPVCKGL
ncbi:MAG: excinuclease ABC subunit A, partial [Bdellovibrionales bacterium]|nr:excinuclease ABC subunit A [Bdellovibrionales bacterium]